MDSYTALREAAAWIDLTDRGTIRLTGQDRTRLLHAMTTNDIEQLNPGDGCYAFFLNAQGRILADVNILCLADAFVLDTEPETREFVFAHIDKYIIADDVTLEDSSDPTAVLGVEGPSSEDVLKTLGAMLPEAPHSHVPWEKSFIARLSVTGQPGFRIFAPVEEKETIVARLETAGALLATADAVRTVRLENGRPRYGEDFTDRHLPQETQLLHAVHFNKGCYLGQEIVERIRSRGGVHRHLVRLAVDADTPPESGTKITAETKDAGEITSAAYSPALGKVAALGYVRLELALPEGPLEAAGLAVRVLHAKPA